MRQSLLKSLFAFAMLVFTTGIAFSQGEAAMMINWFGFAAMCEVDENSKVKGKIPSGKDSSGKGFHSPP